MTTNIAPTLLELFERSGGRAIALLLPAVMRGSLLVMVLGLSSSALACSVDEGGPGDACLRSTECAPGLVCIERVCSDDLSSIADPGEVPMLMPEAGMEPMPDAGDMPADAATMMPPADAAMMMMPPADAAMMTPAVDAAMPVDGG